MTSTNIGPPSIFAGERPHAADIPLQNIQGPNTRRSLPDIDVFEAAAQSNAPRTTTDTVHTPSAPSFFRRAWNALSTNRLFGSKQANGTRETPYVPLESPVIEARPSGTGTKTEHGLARFAAAARCSFVNAAKFIVRHPIVTGPFVVVPAVWALFSTPIPAYLPLLLSACNALIQMNWATIANRAVSVMGMIISAIGACFATLRAVCWSNVAETPQWHGFQRNIATCFIWGLDVFQDGCHSFCTDAVAATRGVRRRDKFQQALRLVQLMDSVGLLRNGCLVSRSRFEAAELEKEVLRCIAAEFPHAVSGLRNSENRLASLLQHTARRGPSEDPNYMTLTKALWVLDCTHVGERHAALVRDSTFSDLGYVQRAISPFVRDVQDLKDFQATKLFPTLPLHRSQNYA